MRDAAVISRRGTVTPLISVPARDADEIRSPTSSIITKDVVEAYSQIAGDFGPAVPFALLEARRFFARQAASNPADSDENTCRKVACEAIARRIVQRTPMEEQYALLSKRYTVIESDGDESLPTSALESAVDQRATYFLSSNEAQRCVFAVWKGLLVQQQQPDGNIEYQRETHRFLRVLALGADDFPFTVFKIRPEQQSFWWHFDPQRIAVPRYQFFFRVGLWILFLVCYTLAIQTPDRGFGPEDIILYTQLLGYLVEDLVKVRLSCLCFRCKREAAGLMPVFLRADLQDRHLRDHLGVADRQLAHLFARRRRFRVRSFCLAAPSRAFVRPSLTCFLSSSPDSAALISVPMTRRNKTITASSPSVSCRGFIWSH